MKRMIIELHVKKSLLLVLLSGLCWTGCKKLLDVPAPEGKTIGKQVFNNKDSAIAAVTGIYSQISSTSNLLSGVLSVYSGVYCDELAYTGQQAQIREFSTAGISAANTALETLLWAAAYKFIYSANACIEGIEGSKEIPAALKNQLIGECRFLRALLYFHLIRCFGGVPLVKATSYMENEQMPRASIEDVERFIQQDLEVAKMLLSPAYPTAERVRANRWTATALLTEYYLYKQDWASVDREASAVINAGDYHLEDISKVFLSGSKEAIFQLQPVIAGHNTMDGNWFIPAGSGRPGFILSTSLLAAFEAGDKRRTEWVGTRVVNGITYESPLKYKKRVDFSSNFKLTEYSVVLRLSTVYLARAEARTAAGELAGAIADLDTIRRRAGLPLIAAQYPAMPAEELMGKIQHERRIELFSECGHRWYDLKRTGKANEVMKAIKPQWQETNNLWPIPASQILINPALIQNEGYK
jgi:starch-binding outer membrane protein, SusD/RagB family